MNSIVEKLRALWDKDQIRVLVLLSLTMQIFLIIFAPFRKRSGNNKLHLLLWLVYLGSDYVAMLALSSILTYTVENVGADSTEHNLLPAFWAPFLLIHLGGPDSITSCSLEDNELWLRHLLSFFVRVSVALMVLVLSKLQSTELLVPSILTFLVGTIKFGERTVALRSAATKQIWHWWSADDVFHNYITRLENGWSRMVCSDVSDAGLIYDGYISFWKLWPYMVNVTMSVMRERKQLSFRQGGRDFKIIDISLSFFYDILHTKAALIHHWNDRLIRLASLVSISIALILFHISEKPGYDSLDVTTTYILLSVALFVDICYVLLLIASEWTISSLMFRETLWSTKLAEFICATTCRGNNRWWSGRMGQYNHTQFIMKSWVRVTEGRHKMLESFRSAWDLLFGDNPSAEVSGILEDMMIEHAKSLVEGATRRDCYALTRRLKSSWIANTLGRYGSYLSNSKEPFEVVAFDVCVITWHMATEFCYVASNDTDGGDIVQGSNTLQGRKEAFYRVSNYMMYLLLNRSEMMPARIFEETIETTPLKHHLKVSSMMDKLPEDTLRDVRQVIKCLAGLPTEDWMIHKSKSVRLFGQLLMDLRNIGHCHLRWKVICDAGLDGNADICSTELQRNGACQGSKQGRRAAHPSLDAIGSQQPGKAVRPQFRSRRRRMVEGPARQGSQVREGM